MKKKKVVLILVLLVILVIIIAVAVVAVVLMQNNSDDEKSKEEVGETEINWQETYIAILEDEENFEDMEDTEIQLLDLDEDETPELIVYGKLIAYETDDMDKFVAKVYTLIEDGKSTEEIQYESYEEFDIELKYNLSDEEYSWYAVESESQTVYALNDGELEEYTNSDELISAEGNYSEKVEFTVGSNSSEIEEAFENAQNGYVETSVIQESFAEIVEFEQSIDKIDSTKALVYTKESYVDDWNVSFCYPAININSDNVKATNEEIEETGNEFTSDNYGGYAGGMNYQYYISDNILSVVLYYWMDAALYTDIYNIDLETYEQLSTQELLEKFDLDEQKVIEEAKDASLEMYDEVIEQEAERLENSFWGWEDYWKEVYEGQFTDTMIEDVEELNLFVDGNGDLCLIAHYQIEGGQWSQYIAFLMDITDEYSSEEFSDWLGIE